MRIEGTRGIRWLFLAFSAAVAMTNRFVDPDLFWHLQAGREILENGRIALPDSSTYLFSGTVWVNQQWITEVLFAAAFSLAGYWGLLLVKGSIVAATVWFILKALEERHPAAGILTACVFLASTYHYLIFRTHLMSLLCMAALVFLLERVRPGRRLLWIALLFAGWANLHTLFSLGLVVLGCYVAASWVRRGFAFDRTTLLEGVSVPAGLVATLVNPFGFGVWKTSLSASENPDTYIVTEWRPAWEHIGAGTAGFAFLLLVVIVLIVLFPKRVHWPSLAAAGVIALFGLRHVRFVSDAALPAVPLLGMLLHHAVLTLEASKVASAGRSLRDLSAAAMIGVITLTLTATLASPITTRDSVSIRKYPEDVVRWMEVRGYSGRIFNEFAWGGLLAWSLPGTTVYVDGRTGVLLYPHGHLTRWRNIVQLKKGWEAGLEEGHPRYVLLSPRTPLAGRMKSEPGWRTLYEDADAVLFARDAPSSESAPPGQPH